MQNLFINLLGIGLYLTPFFIAVKKKSQLLIPVLIINLFFGWTIVGWIVAFALALKRSTSYKSLKEAFLFRDVAVPHGEVRVSLPPPLPAAQVKPVTVQEKARSLPYQKKDYLLSIAERKFFDVLYPIAQEYGWYLFAKVRLEDLFWLPGGMFKSERWSWRGRIKSRHVDFLLCDKKDIRPIAAIELDDASHNIASRIIRDDFYKELFEGAGLPLVRFPARGWYDPQELITKIKTAQST